MIQSTFFAGVLAAFLAAFLGGVISVIRLAFGSGRMVRYCGANDNRVAPEPGVGLPIPRVGLPIPKALTLRYRDFSDLNDDPCLRVRLTGSLAGRFNLCARPLD